MSIIPTTVKSQQLVEKRREQIVLAAIRLFAQKGFYKTTLRELAEEAGISHGNIYDYVGTKEDIFFLIHQFMHNLAMEVLDRSTEDIDDPVERLRRMVRSEFNLMYDWADAILLIYQEGHILNKTLLKQMLKREKRHILKYEQVIAECVKKGYLRDSNVRIAANLIKVMADAWVLKRWDLRGQVSQLEMEKAILDLVFYGLLREGNYIAEEEQGSRLLEGKSALVINGATVLGNAISRFLFSKGSKIGIYNACLEDKGENVMDSEHGEKIRLYTTRVHGPMTESLLQHIVDDFGPFDIFVHDLAVSFSQTDTNPGNKYPLEDLDTNLRVAQDLAPFLNAIMSKRGSGRIIYIAPWAWDRYRDRIRYEAVKAATVALTKEMAKLLASSNVNVNCIIPGFIREPRPSRPQKERPNEAVKEIPAGHLGEIPDITDALYFLVSDASKYVTGQVINVTGGME